MKKSLAMLLLCASMVIHLSIPALAANYTIQDCWWEETNGKVAAGWEQCDEKTTYRIQLYRGNNHSGTKVGPLQTSAGGSKDLSELIAGKGTGNYYFTVYAVKDEAQRKIASEQLEVDSYYLKQIKDYVAQKQANDAAQKANSGGPGVSPGNGAQNPQSRWEQAGSTWYHINANGQRECSCWSFINGHWYYFAGDGAMLTGWHWIDGDRNGVSECYYLAGPADPSGLPEGALYVSRTTPDGYYVNSDGAWCDNGIVQIR